MPNRLEVMQSVVAINLTEQQASAEYGPSVHWFRRARWKGNGPAYIKLAGKVMYPRCQLDKFFDDRLVKSTSEAITKHGVHSKPPQKAKQQAA